MNNNQSIDNHVEKLSPNQQSRRLFLKDFLYLATGGTLLAGCGSKLGKLKPYQRKFLDDWEAKGRPNPFENNPEATKYLRDKGYDPNELTDSQALDALEHARNLAQVGSSVSSIQ